MSTRWDQGRHSHVAGAPPTCSIRSLSNEPINREGRVTLRPTEPLPSSLYVSELAGNLRSTELKSRRTAIVWRKERRRPTRSIVARLYSLSSRTEGFGRREANRSIPIASSTGVRIGPASPSLSTAAMPKPLQGSAIRKEGRPSAIGRLGRLPDRHGGYGSASAKFLTERPRPSASGSQRPTPEISRNPLSAATLVANDPDPL